MSIYYPKHHECGGEIQMWPRGFGLCLSCGFRIKPAQAPDPNWTQFTVIHIHPPITQDVLDETDSFNEEHRHRLDLAGFPPNLIPAVLEIDAQNLEGRAQLPFLRPSE